MQTVQNLLHRMRLHRELHRANRSSNVAALHQCSSGRSCQSRLLEPRERLKHPHLHGNIVTSFKVLDFRSRLFCRATMYTWELCVRTVCTCSDALTLYARRRSLLTPTSSQKISQDMWYFPSGLQDPKSANHLSNAVAASQRHNLSIQSRAPL